jgi:ABC-type transporter MlaC component
MNPGRWLALWLVLALALPLEAQEDTVEWRLSPKPLRDAVRQVVEAQLQAIRAKDFEGAYHHASRGIRRQFSAPVFTAMLKRGYPALLRHVSADFGVVRDNREREATVAVTVQDQLQRSAAYRYYLIREDGAWRIEGVVSVEARKRGDI